MFRIAVDVGPVNALSPFTGSDWGSSSVSDGAYSVAYADSSLTRRWTVQIGQNSIYLPVTFSSLVALRARVGLSGIRTSSLLGDAQHYPAALPLALRRRHSYLPPSVLLFDRNRLQIKASADGNDYGPAVVRKKDFDSGEGFLQFVWDGEGREGREAHQSLLGD